jgi:hypothetical protein
MLRCTRLFLPLETSSLAADAAGLTYSSRTLQNQDTQWGRGAIARVFGTRSEANCFAHSGCEIRAEDLYTALLADDATIPF